MGVAVEVPYSARTGGLHDEARCVLEDAVVGDQRNPESDGRGGDPTVGIMLTLAERVAGALAGDAEFGVGADEIGAGEDDLDTSERGLHAAKSRVAPSTEERAVANLGHGLE